MYTERKEIKRKRNFPAFETNKRKHFQILFPRVSCVCWRAYEKRERWIINSRRDVSEAGEKDKIHECEAGLSCEKNRKRWIFKFGNVPCSSMCDQLAYLMVGKNLQARQTESIINWVCEQVENTLMKLPETNVIDLSKNIIKWHQMFFKTYKLTLLTHSFIFAFNIHENNTWYYFVVVSYQMTSAELMTLSLIIMLNAHICVQTVSCFILSLRSLVYWQNFFLRVFHSFIVISGASAERRNFSSVLFLLSDREHSRQRNFIWQKKSSKMKFDNLISEVQVCRFWLFLIVLDSR